MSPYSAEDVLVSVIIPVKDAHPRDLVRCLDSIFAQDSNSFEVLVVDDGSSVEVASTVPPRYLDDFRLRLYRKSNSGVSDARNLGIREARGRFMCFVDADDWIAPEFLSAATSVAVRLDADIVFGALIVVHDDEEFVWSPGRFPSFEAVILDRAVKDDVRLAVLSARPSTYADLQGAPTNVLSALYKRSSLEGVTFPSGIRQSEDRIFNFNALASADRVVLCADGWYFYDQRGASSATRGMSPQGVLALLETSFEYARLAVEYRSRDVISATALAGAVLLNLKAFVMRSGHVVSMRAASSALRAAIDSPEVRLSLEMCDPKVLSDALFRRVALWKASVLLLLLGRVAARRSDF